jgi:hypothetical protein
MKIKVSIDGASQNVNIYDLLNFANLPTNLEIYINNPKITSCDIWFVIEAIGNSDCNEVVCSKVIYLGAETIFPVGYFDYPWGKNFLSQFDSIYSPGVITGSNVIYSSPFLPWMFSGNHGSDFANLQSDQLISKEEALLKKVSNKLLIICSNKQETELQRLRYKFAVELKKRLGEKVVWFGSGVQPINKKSDAILPYKYHLVMENQIRPGLFSEKLYDAFIGLSLPFYCGAPDVASKFPDMSLVNLNLFDFMSSVNKIERAIQENEYEKRLDYILHAREIVLKECNILKRIYDIAFKAVKNEKLNTHKLFIVRDLKDLKIEWGRQNIIFSLCYKFLGYIAKLKEKMNLVLMND